MNECNSNNINVLCFCETWESGGIESFIANIAQNIHGADIRIDICMSELRSSVFTDRLKKIGIRFFELSGSQRKVCSNLRAFRKLINTYKYDVIHINICQGMGLQYANVAKNAGVKHVIVHSHNTELRKSKTVHLKRMLHKLYSGIYTSSADELWASSKAAAYFMFPAAQIYNKGYTFIADGIDINRFAYSNDKRKKAREKLNIGTETFVLGNVGRLCFQKNQSFILDIFAEFVKMQTDSILLLIGEGEMKAALQQKARDLDIYDKVVFYGVSDQVEKLYSAMDAFVFPSLFEGLGIAAIEAQAAGLPTYCSEHIPKEAEVADLLVRIPIAAGAKEWAEIIEKNKDTGNIRTVNHTDKLAVFDIKAVSDFIRSRYLCS